MVASPSANPAARSAGKTLATQLGPSPLSTRSTPTSSSVTPLTAMPYWLSRWAGRLSSPERWNVRSVNSSMRLPATGHMLVRGTDRHRSAQGDGEVGLLLPEAHELGDVLDLGDRRLIAPDQVVVDLAVDGDRPVGRLA